MRSLVKYISDLTGNMPPLPGIFPDYQAPIVRNNQGERELAMARWGMPSPVFALKGRNSDSGITNVRNVKSPPGAAGFLAAWSTDIMSSSFRIYFTIDHGVVGATGAQTPRALRLLVVVRTATTRIVR